jgi:hypothetical protein
MSEQAQIALDDGEFDEHQIVDGQFLKAGAHRTALFEPANTAFDDIATAILIPIVGHGSSRLWPATRLFWGDDRSDAMLAEPVPNPLITIRPVCCEPFRTTAWTPPALRNGHAVHDLLKLSRFMRLAWKDERREWQCCAITHEMHLGAKATA